DKGGAACAAERAKAVGGIAAAMKTEGRRVRRISSSASPTALRSRRAPTPRCPSCSSASSSAGERILRAGAGTVERRPGPGPGSVFGHPAEHELIEQASFVLISPALVLFAFLDSTPPKSGSHRLCIGDVQPYFVHSDVADASIGSFRVSSISCCLSGRCLLWPADSPCSSFGPVRVGRPKLFPVGHPCRRHSFGGSMPCVSRYCASGGTRLSRNGSHFFPRSPPIS
ncbi:unnamed protein product, partial [Prorocentrum cordatum]